MLLAIPAVHAVPAQLLPAQFVRSVTQLPQAPHACWSSCVQTSTTQDQPRDTLRFVHTACAPTEKPEQPLKGGLCVPYTQTTRDKVRDLSHSCNFTTVFARQTRK